MNEAFAEDDWRDARNSLRRLELANSRHSKGSFFGVAALVGAAASLLTLGVLLNLNLRDLRASAGWTQHSNVVLLQAVSVDNNLVESESAARGYLLTGNRAFTNDSGAALGRVQGSLVALIRLVSDNPVQTQRIRALRPFVEARVDRLRWVASLTPSAGRDFSVSQTPWAMEIRRTQYRAAKEIRLRLVEFARAEQDLLRERELRAQTAAVLLNDVALVIAFLAPACGAAGVYLLFRDRQNFRARELQLQLMHAQRMSLMGETASMLAHEINQPLTAANNYLSALKRLATMPESSGVRLLDMADRTLAQIRRASDIIQRLRNFIDKGERQREVEAPSALIADAVSLLGTLNTVATLETDIEPGLPTIAIDRIQLQQVLVNLMRNAIEAMRESAEKKLFLSAKSHVAGEVEFRLRDTGPGLPTHVSERLFQPFISTKQQGMGIGLSICHRIVCDHGGRIWAEAAPDGGTSFCFAIPTVVEEEMRFGA